MQTFATIATVIYIIVIVLTIAYFQSIPNPPSTIAYETPRTYEQSNTEISRGTSREYYAIPLTKDQQDIVQNMCEQRDLPGVTPELLYAMMKVESNFNLNAYSATNDIGILQINLKYFDSYVQSNPNWYRLYNINIEEYTYKDFTTQVITAMNALEYWLSQTHDNITGALNCYNRGFSYFRDQNHTYSDKIYKALREIKGEVNK